MGLQRIVSPNLVTNSTTMRTTISRITGRSVKIEVLPNIVVEPRPDGERFSFPAEIADHSMPHHVSRASIMIGRDG